MNYNFRVAFIPLWIILFFWISTYSLYASDLLIVYPPKNDFLTFSFLTVCSVAIIIGYTIGIYLKVPVGVKKYHDIIPIIGFFSLVVLFFPIVHSYTGNNISSFFDLLTSPSEAYSRMVHTVTETRDSRIGLIIIKTILSPFTVTALPCLFFTFFKHKKHGKLLIVLILIYFSMSVFRGTDKEIFDLFIIGFASLLVSSPLIFFSKGAMKRNATAIIGITLVFCILFSVFSFRKSERLSQVTNICFKGTTICQEVNPNKNFLKFGVILFSRYLTQGYYGLSVSFDGEFVSGGGVGHSRPLSFLREKFLGYSEDRFLVQQLDSLGWASRGLWSTGFVWIANDVPLFVVPLIVFFLSFVMGLSWRSCLQGVTVEALIVFVWLFYTFLYMPSNLQLAQSGDVYFGFIFWLVIFIFRLVLNILQSSLKRRMVAV